MAKKSSKKSKSPSKAKKASKKASKKTTSKPYKKAAKKPAPRTAIAGASQASGFKSLAMHVTEDKGRATFAALKAERPSMAAFSIAASLPENLDPESAAKRILTQALASEAMPSLTAPTVGSVESDFKSLGVETVPLTDTSVVKFRQQVQGVPVYGSLVSVELDNNNQMVSLNSNIATPDVPSYVAKISPQDALKRAAKEAGYGKELPQVTPVLNLYRDNGGEWHLAYMVENVPIRKSPGKAKPSSPDENHQAPVVFDYVVDALTGSLVAALPRTPSAAGTDQGNDEAGKPRQFGIDINGATKMLRDTTLNLETYDFKWADPVVQGTSLPGQTFSSPPVWSPAAVSAHANTTVVASFLRDVLKRNNIDGKGGTIVSSVNCVWKKYERPPGSKNWFNAFWDPARKQMVYGQVTSDGKFRSLAVALDVVAHELFHGVTDHTSKLEYLVESGALNESYSDIFGIIISNFDEPDRTKWNWLIGDGISSAITAFRDFQDPTKFGQPKDMNHFVLAPPDEANDYGGVHANSGIHNFAAFKVMTAKDAANNFLFAANELAAIFYIALTQQLSRQSGFSDSRRGAVLATRSLFRSRPQPDIDARVKAVEAGFDAAGIT